MAGIAVPVGPRALSRGYDAGVREVVTDIEIAAPAGRVWRHLTNFAEYPRWNPFIRRAEGTLRPGARLRVYIQAPGGRGMEFRPIVLACESGRELRWRGRLLVAGLFDGEHAFSIEPLSGGRVRFVHRERFSGVLVLLVWRGLDRDTRLGFEAMNAALKARAEAPEG